MTLGTAPAGSDVEARLRHLELVVTRRIDGLLQGDYQGLLPGAGSEPGEGRLYQSGDDVRRMDWALTARTAVPHVRDAVADHELETWAVVDLSSSVDFGSAACEKRDLVVAATCAMAFLTARGGNRFGALVLGTGGRGRLYPARSGRAPLLALLHSIMTTARAGETGSTDLAGGIETVARSARRRGMVVVASDFLVPNGWEMAMASLGRRHHLMAVEVIDPRDLDLPNVGLVTLVNPETGDRQEVQTASRRLRRRYAEAAVVQRKAIAASLARARADHLVLRTDGDWLVDMVRFVASRRRRVASR